jgi:hypothetical protein
MSKVLENCAGGCAFGLPEGVRKSRPSDPVELGQNQIRPSRHLSTGLGDCNYMIYLMSLKRNRQCENSVWRTCTA